MPKYTTIKIGTSLNIQTGEQWIKVDLEATVSEMESVDDAFDATIKKQAELQDKALQSKQLKFSIEAGQPILPVITKEDSKQGDDIIVGYINACTSVDDKVNGIITFEAMCRGNKVLTQAYNKKLSQLQKPTNGKPAKLP